MWIVLMFSFSVLCCTGSEFVTGWTGKRGRKLKSKLEKTKQKVVESICCSAVFLLLFKVSFLLPELRRLLCLLSQGQFFFCCFRAHYILSISFSRHIILLFYITAVRLGQYPDCHTFIPALFHTGILGNTGIKHRGRCFQTPLSLCDTKISNANKYI
jgi:hypothetical protein